MGDFSRPINKALGSTSSFLWWYKLFIYGRLCPICFLWELVMVILCLYSRFHIFNKSLLEEYVSQVEGGPHFLKSCFHATWYSLPPATREMYLFLFSKFGSYRRLRLQASLMDIHHDTSFRVVLKDDSISSASKACIYFCSSKGVGLWSVC
jgi:hypothetical protein